MPLVRTVATNAIFLGAMLPGAQGILEWLVCANLFRLAESEFVAVDVTECRPRAKRRFDRGLCELHTLGLQRLEGCREIVAGENHPHNHPSGAADLAAATSNPSLARRMGSSRTRSAVVLADLLLPRTCGLSRSEVLPTHTDQYRPEDVSMRGMKGAWGRGRVGRCRQEAAPFPI